MNKWWWILGVVVADQLVKRVWIGQTVQNPGVGWGWLGVLVIGVILLKRPAQIGWWLIVGGGASNIIDRLVRGYVIDMWKLPFTAWFNLADVAVVGGGIWLVLSRK